MKQRKMRRRKNSSDQWNTFGLFFCSFFAIRNGSGNLVPPPPIWSPFNYIYIRDQSILWASRKMFVLPPKSSHFLPWAFFRCVFHFFLIRWLARRLYKYYRRNVDGNIRNVEWKVEKSSILKWRQHSKRVYSLQNWDDAIVKRNIKQTSKKTAPGRRKGKCY